MRPKIMIATPCMGTVRVEYTRSLVGLVADLVSSGIGFEYATVEGSIVSTLRNVLATGCLESDCTHLLSIDSDVDFAADLCRRMRELDKPVIGAVYPTKEPNLPQAMALHRSGMAIPEAIAASQRYLLETAASGTAVEGGVSKVESIGLGFTLIQRSVLERLSVTAPRRPAGATTRNWNLKGDMIGFFTPTLDANGMALGEDYSFCQRWRDSGGEVWALIDTDMGHIGTMRYGGSFLTHLRARQKLQTAASQAQPPLAARNTILVVSGQDDPAPTSSPAPAQPASETRTAPQDS
jgi:hypothetical protein